jgi:RNA polymerase sigma factor for flagellar operon FliA
MQTPENESQVLTEQAQPQVSPSASLAAEFLEPVPSADHAARLYAGHNRKQREDDMIVKYLPLVHKIVSQVASYLQPPLSREDLVSAGTIGLVKAARDFDPSRDAAFKTYAYIRIRGAVIDELRSWSFAPPDIKRQFDQAQEISNQMMERDGQMPADEQVAEQLGISTEKMYRIFETARARHFLSIHGGSSESPMLGQMLASSTTAGPEEEIEREELIEALTRAITQLPEKQRRIIVMYYQKELTMKQIAEVLEITESRVSQLHAAALFKLSVRLGQDNR